MVCVYKNLTQTANVTVDQAMEMLMIPAEKRAEYSEKLKSQPKIKMEEGA